MTGNGGSARLLERSGQLGTLDTALKAVISEGQGRVALVPGEAGIGKTTLLRQFCAGLDGSARALWARCDPLFTPRPLGPVVELARVIGGEAAARAADGARPYDIATALVRELAAAPTVVVFEDVHWADEATLDVIRLVARRIAEIPALLTLSYRDDGLDRSHPLRIVLGDLPGTSRVSRLTLAGLSPRAVAELAGPAAIDPRQLHRWTAGNPFFVTEVLATGAAQVPHSVRDAVLTRAGRLSGTAREVLDAAAVVPEPAELWLLEAMAPEASGLDECLGAGMVMLAEGRVEFRHEIARQVVEESLPPRRRAALHRSALATLAGLQSPDLARLAHHAEAAGDADAVLRFAPAAAERAAAAGARREAAGLYQRALHFADRVDLARRAQLLERFADVAYFTGQGEQAAAALRQAVQIHGGRGDLLRKGSALRQLAIQLGQNGAMAEAAAAMSEAVATLEQLPPGPELARAYSTLAAVLGVGDDDAGVWWGTRAMELAERVGCLDAESDALNVVGMVELRQGDLGGLAKLDRSRELAQQAGDELGIARAYVHPALALTARQEWVLAERYLQPGLAFCRERGMDAWLALLTTLAAEAALARGTWDEAAGIAATILSWSADGSSYARATALVILARVQMRRGQGGYLPLLEEAVQLAKAPSTTHVTMLAAAARAEAAWLSGAPNRRIGEEIALVWELGLVDAHWYAGEAEVWRHRAGLSCGSPNSLPEPYRLEVTGDAEGAAQWWQERGCAYDAALALAGSADRALLRRALDILHGCRATPAAAVVSRRLRALGEQGVPRGQRPATAAHPVGLTSREAEILELLGADLSNTEIAARLVLSRRTVDRHVAAILRKLGTRSRGEASAQAARLGLTTRNSPSTAGDDLLPVKTSARPGLRIIFSSPAPGTRTTPSRSWTARCRGSPAPSLRYSYRPKERRSARSSAPHPHRPRTSATPQKSRCRSPSGRCWECSPTTTSAPTRTHSG
jgi:DNA-binding CsgD family transcriptional regulator